jgi:hypothetical protein
MKMSEETKIRVEGIEEVVKDYRVHVPFVGEFSLQEEEKVALLIIINHDYPGFWESVSEKLRELSSEFVRQGYSVSELIAEVVVEVYPSVEPRNLNVFLVSASIKVFPRGFPNFSRNSRVTFEEREYISRTYDASRNRVGKAIRDSLAFLVAQSLARQLLDAEERCDEYGNIIDKISDMYPEALEQLDQGFEEGGEDGEEDL